MKITLSTRALLVAAAVGVAVAVAGIGYAAIPDSNGVLHGCYKAKDATATNGTQLYIVDGESASCGKNMTPVTWSQTGPPGEDGTSVTSEALSAGDAVCSEGGSKFTAAEGNVTYACNGLEGDKGDKGDPGEPGPPGPSAAFTNYGGSPQTIGDGNTQTVASVTVPAGSYVLTGAVHGIGIDDLEFLQCNFVAGGTVNGQFAVLVDDGSEPILADVTVSFESNPIFLRCNAQGGTIQAAGQMIATRVGSVTASQ